MERNPGAWIPFITIGLVLVAVFDAMLAKSAGLLFIVTGALIWLGIFRGKPSGKK
jgi:uncharacterized membrane protein YiaA